MKIIFSFLFLYSIISYLPAEDFKNRLKQEDNNYRTSEYEENIRYCERGLDKAEKSGEKENIAKFAFRLGGVYTKKGDRYKAIGYYQKALEIYRENGEKVKEARTYTAIGTAYRILGNRQKALENYNQALKIRKEMGNSKGDAELLKDIGMVYLNSGDYPTSLKYYREALDIVNETGNRKGQTSVLNEIGIIYGILGDLPKSLEYFNQVLDIKEEIGDIKGQRTTVHNIGNIYWSLGDAAKAFEYYNRALESARETGNKRSEANALNNIAIVFSFWGDYKKAIEYFNQAINIKKSIGIFTRWEESNIAKTYMEQGDLPNALKICEKLQSPLLFGRYYLLKKEYQSAKEEFGKKLPVAEKERAINDMLASYIGYALACEGLKEYNLASRYYKKAMSALEEMRSRLTSSQRFYFFSAEDRTEPYEGLVRVSQYTNEGERGSFYYAEFTRSRLFTESSAKRYGAPETRIPLDAVNTETRLADKIAATYKEMETAFEDKDTTRYKEFEPQLSNEQKEQAMFIEKLRKNYPEYASVMYPQPVYPENIIIKPDEVIIEYEVTAPYTEVFVIKDNKIVYTGKIQITRKELNELVKKYRSYFEGLTASSQLTAYEPQTGNKLYGLLLKNIFEKKDPAGGFIIPKDAKITIMPDEILGILPFESLVTAFPEKLQMPSGKFGPVPIGVKYVGDEYDIIYYHSATALTMQRNKKRKNAAEKSLLVIADPIFSLTDSRARGTKFASSAGDKYHINTMDAVSRQMGLSGARAGISKIKETANSETIMFPRLDKTGILADDLVKKVFQGTGADVLTGFSASEKELGKTDLSKYKYLVFATHGILDDTVPYIKEPALVLTQLGTDGTDDGFLTMTEIMGLKLNADIVALTACQTGLGRNLSGEGVMGLGRAFQYAGANSVLVSLWNVAEESTVIMAEKFFQYVRDGKTNRQALRFARSDVRRAGYEHPFFWSAFILIGD